MTEPRTIDPAEAECGGGFICKRGKSSVCAIATSSGLVASVQAMPAYHGKGTAFWLMFDEGQPFRFRPSLPPQVFVDDALIGFRAPGLPPMQILGTPPDSFMARVAPKVEVPSPFIRAMMTGDVLRVRVFSTPAEHREWVFNLAGARDAIVEALGLPAEVVDALL